MPSIVVCAALVTAQSVDPFPPERIVDVTRNVPSTWQRRSFAGETAYERLQVEDGRWALRATARDAASALGVRLRTKVADRPIIRWRWKVERLPAGADERSKARDDSAGRLLLVFDASLIPRRIRTICYVWATALPRGAETESPVSSNVKVIAVQSGPEALGTWQTEERDYAADYLRLFGEPATLLRGVSIMTDSDDTRSTAVAFYDFIELDRRR